MNQLNNHLLSEIFSFLATRYQIPLRFVCKRWNSLIPSIPKEEYDLVRFVEYENLFKWAYSLGCSTHYWIEYSMVQRSSISLLDWWFNLGKSKFDARLFNEAAGAGQIQNIIWLEKIGLQCCSENFLSACKEGQLAVLKWSKERNIPLDPLSLHYTIESGNIEMMEWLINEGFHLDSYDFENGCKSNDLKTLEWLKQKQCPTENLNHLMLQLKEPTKIWLQTNGYL